MQTKQVLHKLLQKTCPEMHKKRRTALTVNVMAALHGEVVHRDASRAVHHQ